MPIRHQLNPIQVHQIMTNIDINGAFGHAAQESYELQSTQVDGWKKTRVLFQ